VTNVTVPGRALNLSGRAPSWGRTPPLSASMEMAELLPPAFC
jgi:hypothetical protein